MAVWTSVVGPRCPIRVHNSFYWLHQCLRTVHPIAVSASLVVPTCFSSSPSTWSLYCHPVRQILVLYNFIPVFCPRRTIMKRPTYKTPRDFDLCAFVTMTDLKVLSRGAMATRLPPPHQRKTETQSKHRWERLLVAEVLVMTFFKRCIYILEILHRVFFFVGASWQCTVQLRIPLIFLMAPKKRNDFITRHARDT